MTKSTKTEPLEQTVESPELNAAEVRERQLKQAIDDSIEAFLMDLEARISALDPPPDGSKFKAETSDSQRYSLRAKAVGLARSWHIPPPRPQVGQIPPTPKGKSTGMDRAGYYDSSGRRIG